MSTLRSIGTLLSQLKKTRYDWVIDGQGNFKSALFTLAVKGRKAGFDFHSVREPIAHLAYEKKISASRTLHAIERLRRLFAGVLGYVVPASKPAFLIQEERFIHPGVDLEGDYFVFLHNASWQTKLWPEGHWIELIRRTVQGGTRVLLPWGSEEERMRAERLAISPQVTVLPKLRLREVGYVLKRARACVAMDTGLSHLAAALGIPCVTLYGATDAGLIGASGGAQVHLRSSLPCSPCQKKTCRFNTLENPCLAQIGPDQVYEELLRQASFRYL